MTINYEKKKYIYVNEIRVGKILYSIYKLPNKDLRDIITVKGRDYISIKQREDKYIFVMNKKIEKVKDVKKKWNTVVTAKELKKK